MWISSSITLCEHTCECESVFSAVPVMGVGPRQEIQLKVCKGGFLLTSSVELETAIQHVLTFA